MTQTVNQLVSHFNTDAVPPVRASMTVFRPVDVKIPFDLSVLWSTSRFNPAFRAAERNKISRNLLTEMLNALYMMRQAHAHAFQA